MTDREPDNLYDALRDRLADYGQEPPAPLWANIRAQLPPPVAAPQLRRRALRRRLAALALLLMVSAGVWQWSQLGGRHPAHGGQLATQASRAQVGAEAAVATERASAAPSRAIATPAESGQQAAPAVASTAEAAGAAAGSGSFTEASKLHSASRKRPFDTGTAAVEAATTKAKAETEAAGALGRSQPALVAFADASRRRELAARRRNNEHVVGADAATPRTTYDPRRAAPDGVGTAFTTPNSANGLAAEVRSNSQNQAVPAAPSVAVAPAPTASSVNAARQQAARNNSPSAASAAAQSVALAGNSPGAAASQPLRAAMLAQERWALAAARISTLQLPTSALPAPLARVDTLPHLPVAARRRWAVLALAGPALTSRALGIDQRSYAATSPTNLPGVGPSNISYGPKRTSTWQPENEQAASGFGAEVQLHRQLSGRWSLGTGLGYHAFATNQTVDVRVKYGATATSNALRPDSVGSLQVRNTHHFLTLPLRVGYQLGAGHPRLRYGLRAGADVAFYLGGRSFEGNSSSRTNSSWGSSGSPYRPLSLALSVGADVRYQLGPRWEVVAQPTLTQFVTSVARPASGYVARYPLAATALVGVAWWLR